MPARIKSALLFLLAAYWIVTLMGLLLTLFFGAVYQLPDPQEMGLTAAQSPAYRMTEPFHPLLNFLVFPWFGWLYLRRLSPASDLHREALRLGVFWTVITMVVDLVGWVLIPHPWVMTLQGFYIDYQPWITLVYLVIAASPSLALALAPAWRAARRAG